MPNTEANMILGRYQPIETAGEGGFAKVIHAYDTRLKREVAIKVVDLPSSHGTSAEYASTLGDCVPGLAEARAAGKLANANIVTIYDCEVADGKAYVIEEYVEGITLTTLLQRFGESVNLDVIAHIFKSVATAAMAAHKENILHLDIKPDNILIGRGGDVKVADFGLATLMDLNGEGSASAGTLGYMPLEQMRHENLDVRTDEWSLAMVTYEMLVGTNPFAGAKTVSDAEKLMLNAELVVPSARWEELTDEADDAVFKALNVNRDYRLASVRQFMSALRSHLGGAAEGKKQLAVLVNGNDEKLVDTSTVTVATPAKVTKTKAPIIDALGWRGCDIISKTAAAIATALIMLFVANNIRIPFEETTTVLQTQPAIAAIVALAAAVFTWVTPRFGIIVPFAAVEAMCNLNSAWSLMAFYAITFLLWWSFLGRFSNESSACCLFATLAGTVGLTPVAVAFAGAIQQEEHESAIMAAGVFLQAFTFGVFGSCNVFSWDIASNFAIADTTKATTLALNNNFMEMFTNINSWLPLLFWAGAAVVFAFFCNRKSKAFHILGALVAGVVLIMSAFFQFPIPLTAEDVDAAKALAAVAADVVAIALAASGLTNRTRLEVWEW